MPIGWEYDLHWVCFRGDVLQDMDQAATLDLGHNQVVGQGGYANPAHRRMVSHICIVYR